MNELIQELSVMPMGEFVGVCVIVVAIIALLFSA